MSPSTRRGLWFGVLLLGAALMQSAWADSLRFHGGQPDFLTATAILCALFADANEGAGLGFSAGLLYACLAAPLHGGFGSLIVSRTLVCFGVGWLEERIFRDNALIAVALVAGGTALVEGLFFVFAPQHNIVHWARGLGMGVLVNALLALPLYLLVRRCVRGLRETRSTT